MNSSYLEDVTGLAQGSSKMVKVRCQSNASPDCVLECERQYSGVRKRIERDGKYICQKCIWAVSYPEKKYTNTQKVTVECNSKISEGCSINTTISYRFLTKNLKKNNGVYICEFCSFNFKGRNSPVCKYKTLDDGFFTKIDTEFKAYLLGWIASDGYISNNGFKILRKDTDEDIVKILKDGICPELPLMRKKNIGGFGEMNGIGFNVYSAQISKDLCKHLQINPGKKSFTVKFPNIESEELTWAFIRGMLDGDGTVNRNDETTHKRQRGCAISSCSPYMKQGIGEFCKIKHYINDKVIGFSGTNAVDFLSKVYDNADEKLKLKRKYDLYLAQLDMCKPIPKCYFVKTNINAIPPSKRSCSDEGYDLWLIEIDKKINETTTRYDTCIKIQPEEGWHVEILPRSSLSNSGYMLSNSVGLIDSSYRGTLKVTLTKIANDAEDIKLPFKAVQMVLRKNVHYICEETEELDDTERGEGGFGSTN